MSTFLQLEGLIGPTVIAWLALRIYLKERGAVADIELAGAAVGIGLGFTSISFFLWRLMEMPPGSYPAFEIGLQALLAGAVLYWRHRHRGISAPADTDITESKATRILGATVAALAVCAAAALLWHFTARVPHGEWDGWAIWNLRAKFLADPTHHWRDGFTSELGWSHPDYPLLLPASVARLWTFADAHSVFGPRMIAIATATATALVLAGSVARSTGILGMSLGLALLLNPGYLFWAVSQCADVPLGLYVLTAVAFLSAQAVPARYLVAGLAAGFAAWTKNEGLVAAVAVLLPLAFLSRRAGDDRRTRLLVCFVVGMAVGGMALLTFSLTVAPSSDLLRQIMSQQPLDVALQADRHAIVISAMTRELSTWGNWFPVPAFVLVFGCLLLATFHRRQMSRQITIGASVVAVMLIGYYCVYVLSPYDLEWHLSTSWPRLVAQIWPTLVWTAVMAAAPPAPRL